ncbi:MAG TPA: Crp/Fnr family transcriptional regulator [Bacillales bacterium]|nr:Crp/Fnr family transcriptional regulator [Bacillales bacterium]
MYTKWTDLLLQTDLFKNIEKEELTRILICLRPRIVSYKHKANTHINMSESPEMGIVLIGEVAVIKETLSGDRIFMSKLKSGDIFGEITAFSNEESPVTIEPLTDSTILYLPSCKIVGICSKVCIGHEMIIRNMLEIVSRKAVDLNKKLEILSLKSIREKISNYLLEQYNKEHDLTFTIPLKRHELAEFLNIPRPSLSRELKKMKDEGIIDFYLNSFIIVDFEELKKCI